MKPIRLARSPEGLRILDDWHQRFQARLPVPVQAQQIETRFGGTTVLSSGPEGGLPLLLLHGAMAGAPHALGELAGLPGRRRIHAVNIPGQSTRAAAIRLRFGSDEYADWAEDVVAALGLERLLVAGVSWGGAVALELARRKPDWLRGLILVVPAGIVHGPIWPALRDVAWPILRYRMAPDEDRLRRALQHLTTNDDPLWTPYLGDVFRHWRTDFSAPPRIAEGDLAGFPASVHVFAADRDRSFPGEALLRRAEAVFPNLHGGTLLRDSAHTPSFRPEDREAFAAQLEQVWSELEAADEGRRPT